MKKNANKGFSLVELIIVIAIMAVLIGVLAPQFIKHVENSRQSTDMDNVSSLRTAIETAVANEEITGDVTITINGSAKTATASGTGVSSALADVGVATTVNFKSGGWVSATAKYDVSTFKWSAGACSNTKGKHNDLADVFK